MLSVQETQALVAKLVRLCPRPTSELHHRSKLSRGTVKKFLNGVPIREAKLQKLLSVTIEMIEERQTRRNALLAQQKRLQEAEIGFDSQDKETKSPSSL